MINHISGTVICNMVILLQTNKITLEKSENLKKKESHKAEPG